MDIVSLCPLRATSMVWQPAWGRWTLTVVCKATYRLLPEVSPLHEEQEYPNEEDSHWDDDPHRSLSAPTDLVPFKAKAEVLLVGQAFAPGKQPVRSLVARMIVEEVDKAIEVFGKRAFLQDGQFWEGPGFTSMPLVYERAAGGPNTWNPVGMRLDGPADAYGRVAIPHLQPLGVVIKSRGEPIPAIGFGPIAPTWPERSQRIERHRGLFSPVAWREQPVPADLDLAYFNAAPRDQQLDALRPDERIVLENLHPEHPRLVTNLPGVRPRVFGEKSGASPQEVGMGCDTLWIDTDRGICTLTWRGHVPLEGPAQAGRVLIALEEQGQRVSWTDVVRMDGQRGGHAGERHEDAFDVVGTALLGAVIGTVNFSPELAARAVLPFQEPVEGVVRAPQVRPVDGVLPFVQANMPAGAPSGVAFTHLPLLQAAVSSGPTAPAKDVSPWTEQRAQTPGPTIGQIALYSPDAPPPSAGRSIQERERNAAATWAVSAAVHAGAKPSEIAEAIEAPIAMEAVLGVAIVASNAAVASSKVTAKPDPMPPQAAPPAEARTAPREMLELIWYDPAALPRIRRHLGWKKIIVELKLRSTDEDFDGGLPPDKTRDAKDRRDIFGVLARGEPADMDGIEKAVSLAVGEDGSFVPPYVLTAGELSFPFDEREVLKAMSAVATPFTAADKRLKDAVDAVNELLKSPSLHGLSGLMEGLIVRLREAFRQSNRILPEGHLDIQTERFLLEQRCYQKRTIVAQKCIRALIVPSGSTAPIPTYIPESVTNELPIFYAFSARIVAETRLQIDQYETNSLAFRVLALGRTVRPRARYAGGSR